MDLLNDLDYQDYRELICFERPSCVLLHYIHGVTTLRSLLFDRFFFERKNQELVSSENALSAFLNQHGVHHEKNFQATNTGELVSFLKTLAQQSDENTAAILPYYSQIGSSKVLSTWLLELRGENSESGFLTSLRGDDFYFRKPCSFEEIAEKLYLKDGILKYQTLQFESGILSLKSKGAKDIFEEQNISTRMNFLAKSFVEQQVSGKIMGAQALWQEYHSGIQSCDYWKNLVEEGFQKALLVKLFWPIQFFYQPFAVFLKYSFAQGLYDQNSFFAKEGSALIEELIQNAQVITSLAGIFAFRRDVGSFERFKAAVERSLTIYGKIETLFLKEELKCSEVVTLSDSLIFAEIATEQFLKVGSLPRMQPSEGTFFPLTDSAVQGLDKQTIRERLKGSDYHVEHVFSTSYEAESFKDMTFPFVVKSSVGFASGGTFLVNTHEELTSHLRTIKNLNRFIFKNQTNKVPGVLAESFLRGDEYAAECITVNGNTKVLGIFSKPTNSEKDFVDSVYLFDPKTQVQLLSQVEGWASGLLKTVSYSQGPSHIEFRRSQDSGKISLIEINFRPGGSGVLSTLLFLETGVPLLGLMGQSLSGTLSVEKLEEIRVQATKTLFCAIPRIEKAGIIKSLRGEEFLSTHKNVLWSRFMKKVGQAITPPPQGTDYLGMILGQSASIQEMNETLKDISLQVGVIYE